ASKEAQQKAVLSMTTLNKAAFEAARSKDVHAATDITGFSLLGQAHEMATASNVSFILNSQSIPIIEEALEYAAMGLNPEGLYNNREYLEGSVLFRSEIDLERMDVLYDPQTSGGLLLSMSKADGLLYSQETGFPIIGEVVENAEAPLLVV
ncbi:MAG TPA: selenide, water dikinase SelD, partial [Sphaerochaeta sp.]|nr:selenide, water dikinase SelD [Sphaerochaeta sp.]